MIIGRGEQLGDEAEMSYSDPWESQQASAWTPEATAPLRQDDSTTVDGPSSSITFYPATVKAAKVVPRTGPTKVLDKVMPKRQAADGSVRIWGMPPSVAYTIAALVLGGAGWWAYRSFGGRRVATNPRRRGRRGGKARRKR